MVTIGNSDGWLCLEEWNCSGEKREFPLPLVLRASDLNWCPWGKCWNSPYRACSGSLKIGCTLCQICCSLNKNKSPNLITDYVGAKIHNSLQWFSLLNVKIMKPTIERIGLNILNKRLKQKQKTQLKNSWINVKGVDNVDNTRANETYYQISSQCLIHWTGC